MDCTAMGSVKTAKKVKVDYTNFEEVVKALNNRKTTINNVMDGLQDMIYKFQDQREEYYVNEVKEQIETNRAEPGDFDLDLVADRIYDQILNDSRTFIDNYVATNQDNVLDAINEKRLKKEPGYAFLILIDTMKKAFEEV